jgi:hypothetical protein
MVRDAQSPWLWRRREVVTLGASVHLIVGRVASPSKPVFNTSDAAEPAATSRPVLRRPARPECPTPVRRAQAPARALHGAGRPTYHPRRRQHGAATACPRAAPPHRTSPPPAHRRRAQDRYRRSARCRRRDSHPTHPCALRDLRHRGFAALPHRPCHHRLRGPRRSTLAGRRPGAGFPGPCPAPRTTTLPACDSRPPRPPSPTPARCLPARAPRIQTAPYRITGRVSDRRPLKSLGFRTLPDDRPSARSLPRKRAIP